MGLMLQKHHSLLFSKEAVLKNFEIFTVKYLCWFSFLMMFSGVAWITLAQFLKVQGKQAHPFACVPIFNIFKNDKSY